MMDSSSDPCFSLSLTRTKRAVVRLPASYSRIATSVQGQHAYSKISCCIVDAIQHQPCAASLSMSLLSNRVPSHGHALALAPSLSVAPSLPVASLSFSLPPARYSACMLSSTYTHPPTACRAQLLACAPLRRFHIEGVAVYAPLFLHDCCNLFHGHALMPRQLECISTMHAAMLWSLFCNR